jgi:Domain of unknown function (DUF929)
MRPREKKSRDGLALGRREAIKVRRRNRRIVTISLVVSIIAIFLVLALIVEASSQVPGDRYSTSIGEPVSPMVMQEITGVNDSTLSSIGLPSSVAPPAVVNGSPLLLGGKPEVLYIGGEFCPYCAVERWSLILALSHFGTFSGLEYMQSSRTDSNPNTPTFTFSSATYSSQYIAFVAVEELNRQRQTISTLTGDEATLVSQYGTCTATGESGGIPFVDVANAYVVNCGAQFSLPQIAGENWTQVSSQLNDPSVTVAKELDGAANTLIAAVCKVDGGQPASVCGQSFAAVTLGYTKGAASVLPLVGQQSVVLVPETRGRIRVG